MELFFTEAGDLRRTIVVDGSPLMVDGQPYALHDAAHKALADAAIPDGTPFVLGADGCYDAVLNKFFRDLPASGCRSVHTWRAYARDIVTFCRFLDERCGGRRLLDATMDDVRLYYRIRRLTGAVAVDPTTWNRAIAALDKFFRWAVDERLVAAAPFTYREVLRWVGRDGAPAGRRNEALERIGGTETVKCVSLDDYLKFRNIGLLGQLPDGTLDPKFRGRNRLRNAAFAELLVTTGVRLEEGGSVLRAELPDPGAARWEGFRSCKMALAAPTTKGDKGRAIWVPKRVLREYVLPYIREDRDNAVCGADGSGTYDSLADPLLVTAWRATGCTLLRADGTTAKVSYDKLRPADRARLFAAAGWRATEPGMLWLTEQGMPTALNNFEAVFARACERCRAFGIDVWITPHTLRHTFAVYMLTHLIRGTVGGAAKAPSGQGVYRRVIADPLRTLQKLMGHASITTTYKYLTYLEEAEELVDAAVGSWGDALGTPADHAGDAE